jgi:hypothetical protein
MHRHILIVLVVIATACSSPQRTTTEATKSVEPTPNVAATVQAAVSATLAAEKPPEKVAGIGTSAPAPKLTPAPPTLSLTPRPEIRVEVTQFDFYKNTINNTLIIGVVENKAATPAAGIDVAVSLLAESGATVAASQAFTKPNVLKPGAKAGWVAHVDGSPAFKEIKVQVQAQALGGFAASSVTQDFRLEGVSVRPPERFGGPKVSGQVVNTGSRPATLVHIIASVFDASGKILEVKGTFSKLDVVDPGMSAPFEIDFPSARVKEIPKYELFVEGRIRN